MTCQRAARTRRLCAGAIATLARWARPCWPRAAGAGARTPPATPARLRQAPRGLRGDDAGDGQGQRRGVPPPEPRRAGPQPSRKGGRLFAPASSGIGRVCPRGAAIRPRPATCWGGSTSFAPPCGNAAKSCRRARRWAAGQPRRSGSGGGARTGPPGVRPAASRRSAPAWAGTDSARRRAATPSAAIFARRSRGAASCAPLPPVRGPAGSFRGLGPAPPRVAPPPSLGREASQRVGSGILTAWVDFSIRPSLGIAPFNGGRGCR